METTGKYLLSAKIIEIGILRVRNGQVVDEYNALVNPKCHIPYGATKVNHISDAMVEKAPYLENIIDDIMSFIGNDVIVGYNNAGFDMNILYDRYIELRGVPFSNDYFDLMYTAARLVRSGLIDEENWKLETISRHYGLDLTGEHRAVKDCYLTKECYDHIHNEFDEKSFSAVWSSGGTTGAKKGFHTQFKPETLALQELNELVGDIIEDGIITDDELFSLSEWMEAHTDLQGNAPFATVYFGFRKICKKKMSPIVLILIAAFTGIVVYGI